MTGKAFKLALARFDEIAGQRSPHFPSDRNERFKGVDWHDLPFLRVTSPEARTGQYMAEGASFA